MAVANGYIVASSRANTPIHPMTHLNAASSRLLAVLLSAVLGTTFAYWIVALRTSPPSQASSSVESIRRASGRADALFGGQLPQDANRDIHLSGVLTLSRRKAAAIVTVRNGPPRVVPVGSAITGGVKLYEVRARSVVVDRDSVRSVLFLPLNSGGVTSYVR